MKQNLFALILICGSVLVCFATSFCIHTNIFHTSLPSLSHELFDHTQLVYFAVAILLHHFIPSHAPIRMSI